MPSSPTRRALRARSGPIPALRATPEAQRAASLVVCERVSDVSEARDLLVMLGLVAVSEPVPVSTSRTLTEPTWAHQCGTSSGAKAHSRRGERPCEPCRVAQAVYRAELDRRRERAGAA